MDVIFPLIVFVGLAALGIRFAGWGLEPAEQQWMQRALTWAVIVRMLAACAFALFPALRMFHEDATSYENIGLDLAAAWLGKGPPIMLGRSQNFGFYYVSGAVYYLFGAFRVNVSFFNALIGSASMMLVYRMTRRLFHKLVARRAALLVGFFPSMVLWSSIALKDALMTFLIVLCLHSCVRLKERFSLPPLLGVLLTPLAMQTIRFYMFYFIAFAILTSLVIDRGLGLLTGVYKQILIAGTAAALLLIVGLAGGTIKGAEVLDFQRASTFRHGMAVTASSGFDHEADISTPVKALLYLPTGVAVLLLGPFPWQFSTARSLLAAPETLAWWLMLPALIRGIVFAIRNRFTRSSPLLMFSVVMTFGYALVQGNVGAAFRQRAQIFALLFVFAALGSMVKKCRKAGLSETHLLNV